MCGIVGFIDFNKNSRENILHNMTDLLHHRGPDDSGYFFKEYENYQIGLGHRRLSILDLSKHGKQPMKYHNYIISYNGEIYNFKEIKKELESYGDKFISQSDTEVILHSFDRWGVKAIDKFNGMFAFAIFNIEKEELLIFRDRAGVKPLFWYYKNGLFMFSSELKAFHKHFNFNKIIDQNSLALYLQYGYILQPYSIFKNTYKLDSGNYLTINLKTKNIKKNNYWNVIDFYNKPKYNISEKEALYKIENLLKSSFEYRMVSDVPVGLFLSGGYDSSAVAAILQYNRSEKIKTFTIGFREKGYDEAPYAKKIANYLGTDHTEYYCTQKDALNIIPKLPYIYDEPFGDSSAIPTTLVSELAKKKVTVALSADGGDEIFAGYNKHSFLNNIITISDKFPIILKKNIINILKMINPQWIPYLRNRYNFKTRYYKLLNIIQSNNAIESLKYYSQTYLESDIKGIFTNKILNYETGFDYYNKLNIKNSYLNNILAIDYMTYMVDDILTKVDRATMSVSLEGREPLLDYRIIEYLSRLKANLKYKNGDKKYLLKKIVHKYIPKKMMDRKKMGFSIPIFVWFRDQLKEYLIDYLNKDRLNKEGIFDYKEIIKIRDSYIRGSNENIQKLWFFLMFEMWYEKWGL